LVLAGGGGTFVYFNVTIRSSVSRITGARVQIVANVTAITVHAGGQMTAGVYVNITQGPRIALLTCTVIRMSAVAMFTAREWSTVITQLSRPARHTVAFSRLATGTTNRVTSLLTHRDSAVSGEVLPPIHAHLRAIQSTLQVGHIGVHFHTLHVAVVSVPAVAALQLVA
jgi:hypothetical protein